MEDGELQRPSAQGCCPSSPSPPPAAPRLHPPLFLPQICLPFSAGASLCGESRPCSCLGMAAPTHPPSCVVRMGTIHPGLQSSPSLVGGSRAGWGMLPPRGAPAPFPLAGAIARPLPGCTPPSWALPQALPSLPRSPGRASLKSSPMDPSVGGHPVGAGTGGAPAPPRAASHCRSAQGTAWRSRRPRSKQGSHRGRQGWSRWRVPVLSSALRRFLLF